MRHIIVLIAAMFAACALQAQVRLNVSVNIGSQPVWGPTGYEYVEYYYLPDVEVYYCVPEHRYYYFEGGRWIGRSQLPARYHDFDLYTAYKVVINERAPYRHHAKYRAEYAEFKGRHGQEIIRDSRDERYYVIKGHPEHGRWMKEHKHDNGKGRGKRGKG